MEPRQLHSSPDEEYQKKHIFEPQECSQMLSFPRVPSSTPVFYFKLTAGIRERGSELGKVIVSVKERQL